MPYAQQHYPFENKEKFEKCFPANFIAEGIDQTRGWFYTLMVLSTALFDKPPFQNLICNGLVLASDGKKMSKRLKNYPDPKLVVDAYGADALRLYLVNSPVVRAESLRFQEAGVQAVVREVFLPWYNAYRFFVQNAQRLFENSQVDFDPREIDLAQATNALDRWMIASTTSLAEYVKEMEAYRLYTVLPYLIKFIDNLTNIYVRFNRKRLKGANGVEDCKLALAVLFDVLITLCKVMAPFTPYLTELMFQNLNKCLSKEEGSVHWESFPDPAERQKPNEKIQKSVARMQKVIEIARLIRDRKNKPTKLPLKEMTIVHPDEDYLSDLMGDLQVYLSEEINVRKITSSTDVDKYARAKAEPEWSALGRRLGKSMGQVAKGIKDLDPAAIRAFQETGEITVAGNVLKEGDLKIVREFQVPEGFNPDDIDADGDGEVLVMMDLTVDEEILLAKTAREVVNRIQKLRKSAGLEPSDKVEFYYAITSPGEGLDKGSTRSSRRCRTSSSARSRRFPSPPPKGRRTLSRWPRKATNWERGLPSRQSLPGLPSFHSSLRCSRPAAAMPRPRTTWPCGWRPWTWSGQRPSRPNRAARSGCTWMANPTPSKRKSTSNGTTSPERTSSDFSRIQHHR